MLSKNKNAQKKSSNLGYLNFQIFCILNFKFENSIKNPKLCFFIANGVLTNRILIRGLHLK